MAKKYKIKATTKQTNKFKTLTKVNIYSKYMTPTWEPTSKVIGQVSKGKTITSDLMVAVEITVGEYKGTVMYFYHFNKDQGGVPYDYWVPKYTANGIQWLTTNISGSSSSGSGNSTTGGGVNSNPSTNTNYNGTEFVEKNTTISSNNSSFDFDDWVSSKGEYNDEWVHLLRSKMIIYEDRNKWQDSYNFMQFANPYTMQNGTRELLFFTKCDLNIMKDPNNLNPVIANNSFWLEMQKKYRDQISALQKGYARRSGFEVDAQPFIPMLTNMVRSRLDLPGRSMNTMDTSSTIYGTSFQYAGSSRQSDEGHDFTLEIADTPELEIYHLLKMYSMYEDMKSIGIFSPPGPDNLNYYRVNKILHDQFAIYKFVLDANDMESILFYSKEYGTIFKSLPRDSFGEIQAGEIVYSVEFHSQVVRDMEPVIIFEFNKKAQEYFGGVPSNDKYVPVWNSKFNEINGEFRCCPFITECSNGKKTGSRYKLMWFTR